MDELYEPARDEATSMTTTINSSNNSSNNNNMVYSGPGIADKRANKKTARNKEQLLTGATYAPRRVKCDPSCCGMTGKHSYNMQISEEHMVTTYERAKWEQQSSI